MKKYWIFFVFTATYFNLYAQSGMFFSEFAEKLDPYFDKLLIEDIRNQLPKGSDYIIWGWDVGDYSGDSYFDLAFAIKKKTEKGRTLHVYQFVDIDGFLVKVNQFKMEFFELPLEIGVVIRNNTCYITEKQEKFNWSITGYTYSDGSLMLSDKFHTHRIGDLTHESYINYVNLRNYEKYLLTKSGEETFYRDYMILPSYPRGKIIYKGFTPELNTNFIDYVHSGAWHWTGAEDLSMVVSSAYDEQYLYFTANVTDEKVVIQECDTCIADNVEIWFDVNNFDDSGDRFMNLDGNTINFRNSATDGIYRFSFYPGDFVNTQAYVKIGTNDNMNSFQKIETRNIKAVANLTETGYIIKFKIPFAVLGYPSNPISREDFLEMGCTIIANDYDNSFRPEEHTEIATSAFIPYNPSTFGALLVVPYELWYGESENIYKQSIIENLREYGF